MSGHDNSLGEGELIFELPAPPSIPQECPHKLPTPCRLTSFLTCCVCKDQRLLSETSDTKHLTDLDFVMHGKRHERYCWVCEGTETQFQERRLDFDFLQTIGMTA